MISNAVVVSAVLAALCAFLACWAAHFVAARQQWRFIHRAVFGVGVIAAAFAVPLFAALSLEAAATLFLILILICVSAGVATWLNYQVDEAKPQSATPDTDRILARLDDELER